MSYDGHVRWFLPPHRGETPAQASVGYCLLLVAAVKLSLWIAGSGATFRWVRRHSKPRSVVTMRPDIDALEYTVAMAAALYPGRAACLERSLVLFYLARRAGVPVTYHHGVQPLPFKAHAWVEYDGHVINDVPEFITTFLAFPAPILP